jgi:hypothetical protein
LAAAALGVRGWLLAACAPLVTYFVAGLAGPLLSALHVRYGVVPVAVCTLVLVLVCAGARWLTVLRRRGREDGGLPRSDWLRSSHLVVAGVVVLAAAVGGYAVVRGMGWLDSIPQDWDAAFHANGIRYIAETGDGSLYGMGNVNWYDPPNTVFYPNAYHLVAALVYLEGHASVAAVLNANTVLWPGLLALTLVALVRELRGRVTTAGYTALVAVAGAAGVYENMFRGPLLPYELGVVLIPVAMIALHKYLDRPGLDTGLLFVLTVVGLLLIHSSLVFAGGLLALPMLVQRWWGNRSRIWPDVRWIVVAGVVSGVAAAPALMGALHSASSFSSVVWPVGMNAAQAVGSLLTFQHIEAYPAIFLAIGLWIGLFTFRKLGALRWTLGSAALAGALFVAVAAYNTPWIIRIARPFWDDRFRLIALAFLPLAVIAAHGMTMLQDWLTTVVRRVAGTRLTTRVAAVGTAVVLLALFLVATKGLYHSANAAVVQNGYGTAPTADRNDLPVSQDEALAMEQLPKWVKPGDRVLNDRNDGSVWMYAISGVHPVAGHYDDSNMNPEIDLLAGKFNQYDTDQAVRTAVAELHITYVIVDTGFLRAWNTREPGLAHLDQADFLTRVYANPDATIYRLTPLTN